MEMQGLLGYCDSSLHVPIPYHGVPIVFHMCKKEEPGRVEEI